MKRKIMLQSFDGIIQHIQCPNPECDNTLDISSEVYVRGINNIEVTCDICGDNIRVIYKIEKNEEELETLINSRTVFMNNKISSIKPID